MLIQSIKLLWQLSIHGDQKVGLSESFNVTMSSHCALCRKFVSVQNDMRCSSSCGRLMHTRCVARSLEMSTEEFIAELCDFYCDSCKSLSPVPLAEGCSWKVLLSGMITMCLLSQGHVRRLSQMES